MSDDWTVEGGRSNTSAEFQHLVAEVERLIRDSGHTIVSGGSRITAQLIMAQLAHKHGLGPTAAAEERGYQRAKAEDIAALRGTEVWRPDDPHDEFGTGRFVVLTAAADFLAASTGHRFIGLEFDHVEEHFDDTGLCHCPCGDCTTRTGRYCVCSDCRCEYDGDHAVPPADGADE